MFHPKHGYYWLYALSAYRKVPTKAKEKACVIELRLHIWIIYSMNLGGKAHKHVPLLRINVHMLHRKWNYPRED